MQMCKLNHCTVQYVGTIGNHSSNFTVKCEASPYGEGKPYFRQGAAPDVSPFFKEE
jgi:hypothetical protein